MTEATAADPGAIPPAPWDELRQSALMIRTWIPEVYPANEQGQVHFARAVMESVATVIERVLAAPSEPPEVVPLDMILHCPNCHEPHLDAPEPGWTNPPHRSHLCHACGTVWRPADMPTNGVATIATNGSRDSWEPPHQGTALAAIAAERHRQMVIEGHAPADDDRYRDGELIRAAYCYAGEAICQVRFGHASPREAVPPGWPWLAEHWKPRGARDNLIRAGALIAAEIARLDRAADETP